MCPGPVVFSDQNSTFSRVLPLLKARATDLSARSDSQHNDKTQRCTRRRKPNFTDDRSEGRLHVPHPLWHRYSAPKRDPCIELPSLN